MKCIMINITGKLDRNEDNDYILHMEIFGSVPIFGSVALYGNITLVLKYLMLFGS